MSKKLKAIKLQRVNFLSDTLLKLKELLLSNCPKSLLTKVIRCPNNFVLTDNNGTCVRSNLPIKSQNCKTTRVKSWGPQRLLKQCRQFKKQSKSTKSKRCSKVPQRTESQSSENSSTSSTSSSEISSIVQHTNRNILSKLLQHTFYSVVNTGIAMDQGTTAAALCRSFLALYLKLEDNSVYSNILDNWVKAGQKIIVLKGYNHKHLQYLAKEVRHLAVQSNTLYRTTGQARVMLVLTAFGREEDMEELFDDLCYLH